MLEIGSSAPLAVVEAINFASRDLAEVFGRRAAICIAAEDLHDNASTRRVAAFALHARPTPDRLEALQESNELFSRKGVTPVMIDDVEPIRRALGIGFQFQ